VLFSRAVVATLTDFLSRESADSIRRRFLGGRHTLERVFARLYR
jgi:hypothetical protein